MKRVHKERITVQNSMLFNAVTFEDFFLKLEWLCFLVNADDCQNLFVVQNRMNYTICTRNLYESTDKIIESSQVEGTHKYHKVQLLTPHRTTPKTGNQKRIYVEIYIILLLPHVQWPNEIGILQECIYGIAQVI